MQDPRLIVAVTGGVAALAAGAVGVARELARVRGRRRAPPGVIAAIAGVALGARARQSEDRLGAGRRRDPRGAPRARVDQRRAARRGEPPRGRSGARPDRRRAARERGEHAFDAATGLYDEKYFAVLVQQQVAAARRSLRPISVVIFEIDGMGEADRETRLQALGVVGDVVRRTLRESDAACRLGDLMVGAILEDTPEAGAVWAAERVRGTLLASPGRRRAHACRPASRATRRTRSVRPSSCTRRAGRSTKRGPRAATASSSHPKPTS